jgi:very-short-patch-repair endonuclease
LRSMGYKVLRIWESDIKAGCDGVSRTIADFVERNQGGSSK